MGYESLCVRLRIFFRVVYAIACYAVQAFLGACADPFCDQCDRCYCGAGGRTALAGKAGCFRTGSARDPAGGNLCEAFADLGDLWNGAYSVMCVLFSFCIWFRRLVRKGDKRGFVEIALAVVRLRDARAVHSVL